MSTVRITRQCGCKQTFTVVGGEVREEVQPCKTHKGAPEVLSPSPPVALTYLEEGAGN
jgi:hypothetical protein